MAVLHTSAPLSLLLSSVAIAGSPGDLESGKPQNGGAQGSAQSAPNQRFDDIEERLRTLEAKLAEKDRVIEDLQRSKVSNETLDRAVADLQRTLEKRGTSSAPASSPSPKWFDRLTIRGYTQFRFTTLFGENNTPDVHVPNDPSVSETESLVVRRGRVILFGDISEHLYVYAQLDFNGSVGPGGGTTGLQTRDIYADIALDADKEFRFRLGTSKVPFGWVNLQSSQNRGPIERPDALNSAVEGERDLGAYFYWAPKETRALFAELVRTGLKGSGDYGVFGVGVFNGQGLNRPDLNGEPHVVARVSYPFHAFGDQIMELGAQAYAGHYVPTVAAISGVTPKFAKRGVLDERAAVTAILYPKPVGIEAEWNWGNGPQLSDNNTEIDSRYLQGGYVMLSYMEHGKSGNWFPFARWNYFRGNRKFARNAPRDYVNEIDLGIEWAPWKEVEITLMYTHTAQRTNTNVSGFPSVTDEDRIGMQVQWNF